jgi:hypothetical protein
MAGRNARQRLARVVAASWSLRSVAAVFVLLISHGCGPARRTTSSERTAPAARARGETAWLAGSTDQRFALVAKQLRGFDVAMAETGYRYVELYWAGNDRNWDYAAYQVGKIRTAVAHGVERRPQRAPSARMLDDPLDQVSVAIDQRNPAAFAAAFTTLTATCNACHQAERVPFVSVRVPTHRLSPVNAAAEQGVRDTEETPR